jgi:hypothetical protein
MRILPQSVSALFPVEYAFYQDGCWSCIVVRYRHRLYRFRAGVFAENEPCCEQDYFRRSGAVTRYHRITGEAGSDAGRVVQDLFIQFADDLFDVERSRCEVHRLKRGSLLVDWMHELPEPACDDLRFISGKLEFQRVRA